jgi:arabinogalactan endo-1,4-beta-galactosidase
MTPKIIPITAVLCALLTSPSTRAADKTFYSGVDISMLPEIEKAGGVYREEGKATDAIQIFRDHGVNLFRVRLFVKPATDFNSSYGATQDLPYVKALAKRIKSAGGTFLLDFHYSDTWADPGKQFKPAAWKDLDFDALEKQVHDYTASVLKELAADGVLPDMVQVGNEITAGILWPDGKVLDAAPDVKEKQWQRFARLVNAGCKAVREAQSEAHPIRIVIHIHGGGKPGLPKWFFTTFNQNPVDYDIMAVSAYPAWSDSLDVVKSNLEELVKQFDKDVIVAETSYPWREMDIRDKSAMKWPATPEGQKQFTQDLAKVVRGLPNGRGIGFIWWYPEAIPTKGLGIWRNGAEGLFDEKGNALPALDAFRGEPRS